ncbi:hypothetical protein [Flavobacterium limi]|uniref:Cag pathogenicity island protein n=1 Tax=Flavobacterium limi TaxID=2045105 RepID=A0ABQ1UY84_9FLAO|nr:hypothetical protein [Flavobacterium limi]GGF28323.1 hypothetical protein GCM10011518_42070 [Flavobacterium limi]
MENQKNNTAKDELKDSDKDFNARNQYSGSGNFSPDEEKSDQEDLENLEPSVNNDEPESPTDLQQDESGTLKSNN